jgi:hypothetical protein
MQETDTMTVRIGPSIKDRVRDAMKIVQSNPTVIAEMTAEEAEAAKADAAEAKRLAAAYIRVEADLPDRAAALVKDYQDRELAALMQAADSLARQQLERAYGVIPPQLAAMSPAQARISERFLDTFRARVFSDLPLAYDKRGRSGAELRSDQAREAATDVDDVQTRVAQRQADAAARQAQHEAARQAAVAARKEQARAAGVLPRVGS